MKRIVGFAIALLLILGSAFYVGTGYFLPADEEAQTSGAKSGSAPLAAKGRNPRGKQQPTRAYTPDASSSHTGAENAFMRVLSDGRVVSLDEFDFLGQRAEKEAGEQMRQAPEKFGLSSFPPEFRVNASLGAAKVLAETSPERAIELLWPLEGYPALLAKGHWVVFSVWYGREPEAASEYLLGQNLMSEKWAIAVERVAEDWAASGNSLLPELVDAIPTERRDDVIVRAVVGSTKAPNGVAYDLLSKISDPKRRQMVENWIRKKAAE